MNRGGNPHWMAPELLDPVRFEFEFARTPDVCVRLYTGRPPFASLSDTTALLMVLNGQRPERPLRPPSMSDVLWKHVTDFWAEGPTTRPSAKILVQDLAGLIPGPQTPLLPDTPSAPLTPAGNAFGSTPPQTNVLVSAAQETTIPAHEPLTPSLADTDESLAPSLPPEENACFLPDTRLTRAFENGPGNFDFDQSVVANKPPIPRNAPLVPLPDEAPEEDRLFSEAHVPPPRRRRSLPALPADGSGIGTDARRH
ncbi:hypothetical protein K438DRAFT_1060610 [Mycena galopus ATCC 62051]|nr:hypothetical protein K438DRAFT_1060610 [Mycena galopus ATCC 62051]